MFNSWLSRISRDEHELDFMLKEGASSGKPVEDVMLANGIPKDKILPGLSEHCGCPYVEYDENLAVSDDVWRRIDPEELKRDLWFPLAVKGGVARVIANRPDDAGLIEHIQRTLGVEKIEFSVALASDLVRIIENNQDINIGFPAQAGRTPLAKVRDYLADRRSALAEQRTAMARGRTGLAFFRTGIALLTIAVTLIRLFASGWLFLPLDLLLLAFGVAAIMDGLWWYVPVRRNAGQRLDYQPGQKPPGVTVLGVENEAREPRFVRSGPVAGAEELRDDWSSLSPVERRRFLANDRTDMAEERTVLASLRTTLAKARMGLAFTRSGVAFAGLGIALVRKFPAGSWIYFDVFLIAIGTLMALEGFYWYLPGYRAGRDALRRFRKSLGEKNIWDLVFPPLSISRRDCPPVKASHAPGIWGTTGLALERTVLAERRNLMSRLRAIMSYSRSGLAFIRTGASMAAVGAGLIAFLSGGIAWTVFDAALVVAGLALIVDGWRWYRLSERIRKEYPYCYGDMEISFPDYGVPAVKWGRVVFSHDDL